MHAYGPREISDSPSLDRNLSLCGCKGLTTTLSLHGLNLFLRGVDFFEAVSPIKLCLGSISAVLFIIFSPTSVLTPVNASNNSVPCTRRCDSGPRHLRQYPRLPHMARYNRGLSVDHFALHLGLITSERASAEAAPSSRTTYRLAGFLRAPSEDHLPNCARDTFEEN